MKRLEDVMSPGIKLGTLCTEGLALTKFTAHAATNASFHHVSTEFDFQFLLSPNTFDSE